MLQPVPSLVPVSSLHAKWKWGYIRWLGHSHVHCYAWQKQRGLVVAGVCVLEEAKQRSLSEQPWDHVKSDWWNTWPRAVLKLNCHTLLWHSSRHAIMGVRLYSKHIHLAVHSTVYLLDNFTKKCQCMTSGFGKPFPPFSAQLPLRDISLLFAWFGISITHCIFI